MNRDKHIPFSKKYTWCSEKMPHVNPSYNMVISKIVDGKVLKEKESRVINWPNNPYENEPIKIKWGKVFKKGEEWAKEIKKYRMKAVKIGNKPIFTVGEGIYSYPYIKMAFRYLPKKTVLTIQAGKNYPMTIAFKYKGEDWIFIIAPLIKGE